MVSSTKTLTRMQSFSVGMMLFGMFFGAGNMIFPVSVGAQAGSNVWPAMLGLIITGVGLPLLGVTALGLSRSRGLFDLASKAGRGYGVFFTCLLYLTIGPFFAIPRCAATSFTAGFERMIGKEDQWMYLLGFSAVFFAIVLFFALKPGNVLVWIGKILTPVFLVFLAILVIVVLAVPANAHLSAAPVGDYASQPFFTGFLKGYNTMDALASLAFGVVVVETICRFGVKDPSAIAVNTVRSGLLSCVFMAVIYVAVTLVGVRSRLVVAPQENGGSILAYVAEHHLGMIGLLVLGLTVTLACLKTAVGLVVSCAHTFADMIKQGPSYRFWAVTFTLVSFVFANLGLSAIIDYAVPILMFLYPLAIVLIVLALCGTLFDHARCVYAWTLGFTLISAVYDMLSTLPQPLRSWFHLDTILQRIGMILPFSQYGMGWIVPALIGCIVGLMMRRRQGASPM